MWDQPDTTYTARSDYLVLQFNVSAEGPVSVDWNKLAVATDAGLPLEIETGESFFFRSGLRKKGGELYAVRCSLAGVEEPHPVISVDLPLIHIGGYFYKLAPITLEVQQGRHYAFGFK